MASAVSPRDRRLQAGWQFREVYRSGKSFHGKMMTLVSLPRPGETGRVAFVAGRKVGPAVDRNRSKRLLREAFRALRPSVRDASVWRVWIARSGCASSALSAVSQEMDRLVRKEPA